MSQTKLWAHIGIINRKLNNLHHFLRFCEIAQILQILPAFLTFNNFFYIDEHGMMFLNNQEY